MTNTSIHTAKTDIAKKYVLQFIEQTGIYIFFISLMLYTQISWVKRYNKYTQLEARLFVVFIIGIILSFGVIALIKKIAVRAHKDHEAILKNIAVALSPGIFFIFASKNKSFLIVGFALCSLTALYIWVKPFRDFVKSVIYIDKFKSVLIIKDNRAVIEISGIYEKANLPALQSFLIDISVNLHECSERNIKEVKIDFSNLKETNDGELKQIIESIAMYFNVQIRY